MIAGERLRFWVVGAAYLAIAFAFAFPFSAHLGSRMLSLDSDATLVQWIVGWDIHAFTHQPWHIFDANSFAPLPDTLAFAENLIGSALLSAPIFWITGNLALAMNLVALVSIPLSGLGTYLLARRLKVSEAGAILAGIVFAFSPPRFLRIEQFQLTTIQWMPFCLAYVHSYLDNTDPADDAGRRRDLRIALAFFSLQAITAGHGATFLTIAIAALLIYRVVLGEPLRVAERIRDVGLIGALLLTPTVLVYLPYQDARVHQGLVRNLDGWGTAVSSFFASPSHVDLAILQYFPDWLREQPDAYLFPGWIPLVIILAGLCIAARATPRDRWARHAVLAADAIAIACVGLAIWAALSGTTRLKIGSATVLTVRHAWRLWAGAAMALLARFWLRRRVPFQFGRDALIRAWTEASRQRTNAALFYALLTIACFWFLLGPPFGIWPLVYKWPLLNFIRVPTRFMLLGLVGIATLTGMAFDRMTRQAGRAVRMTAATTCCALALIEFAAMPLVGRPYDPALPAIDRWLDTQPKPFTVAELPMPDPDNVGLANVRNARFMLHSTAHWQKTVHGFSGLLPKAHDRLYGAMSRFPDNESLRQLADFGVTLIVVHDDFTTDAQRAETTAATAPFGAWLTFVHEEADGRVYALHRPKN